MSLKLRIILVTLLFLGAMSVLLVASVSYFTACGARRFVGLCGRGAALGAASGDIAGQVIAALRTIPLRMAASTPPEPGGGEGESEEGHPQGDKGIAVSYMVQPPVRLPSHSDRLRNDKPARAWPVGPHEAYRSRSATQPLRRTTRTAL